MQKDLVLRISSVEEMALNINTYLENWHKSIQKCNFTIGFGQD